MSFALGMSSTMRITSKMKSIRPDSDEGRRNSDELEQEEGEDQVAEESRFPLGSSCKRKSEGGTSDPNKRQAQVEAHLSGT